MKVRILLKSFDNRLLNQANSQLQHLFRETDSTMTGSVSLPTRIRRFCVLRSPHIDKDSREHFEIRISKRFVDIETSSGAFLDLLFQTQLPPGVCCSLKLL